MKKHAYLAVGVLGIGMIAATSAPCDVSIKVPDASLVVKVWPSIKEPAVPVFRDGMPVAQASDRFNLIEIYSRTRGTDHYPLVWADLVSNMYLRQTYQKAEGPGARLGTSVVGTPSFRTRQGLQFIPKVVKATIDTKGEDGIRNEITARFQVPEAAVMSVRRFPSPIVGRSEARLSIRFAVHGDIELDRAARGDDAFRLVTLSSMFSDSLNYDANTLRYADPSGVVHAVRMRDDTPRDAHVLSRAVAVGTWFELVKEPGSRWFPDSPTIRVDIERTTGIGRLGVQGYLAGTRDPNDDSLSVWLEWLDVPEVLKVGSSLEIDLKITATAPSSVSKQ